MKIGWKGFVSALALGFALFSAMIFFTMAADAAETIVTWNDESMRVETPNGMPARFVQMAFVLSPGIQFDPLSVSTPTPGWSAWSFDCTPGDVWLSIFPGDSLLVDPDDCIQIFAANCSGCSQLPAPNESAVIEFEWAPFTGLGEVTVGVMLECSAPTGGANHPCHLNVRDDPYTSKAQIQCDRLEWLTGPNAPAVDPHAWVVSPYSMSVPSDVLPTTQEHWSDVKARYRED